MTTEINAVGVFVTSFVVASLSGLAALLRSGVKLTNVGIFSSLLNSGLLGLGISLIWYTQYQENVYFLVGICLIAGLGGMTAVDFVLQAVRKGGFSINLGKNNDLHVEENSDHKIASDEVKNQENKNGQV